MAVYAFGVVVAPILGPTLGGWLTDAYSWRYAFYINIPFGILAAFMISRYVEDPPYVRDAKVGPFDNIGFGLLALWTGSLQIILDRGQEDDWFGAIWLRWTTLLCIITLVWFIVHCLRSRTPLVDLHVLRDRNFAVGCLLMVLFGLCVYSTITVLPLFYQELLGYTAFTAGLVVFPRGLGAIVAMPVIGWLGGKIDARYLLTFGFCVFGIMSLVFGNINLNISPTTLFWPIIITGFALSFVFVPITTQSYGTLPNEQIGNASADLQPGTQHRRLRRYLSCANTARPPRQCPPERDDQLRSHGPATLSAADRAASPGSWATTLIRPTPCTAPRLLFICAWGSRPSCGHSLTFSAGPPFSVSCAYSWSGSSGK